MNKNWALKFHTIINQFYNRIFSQRKEKLFVYLRRKKQQIIITVKITLLMFDQDIDH